MKIIAPFGPKRGSGTWDCIYDNQKYTYIEEAEGRSDYVEGNFIEDEGVLKIEVHHVQTPDIKKWHTLIIQRPIFGIDIQDDIIAVDLAVEILDERNRSV
jgi:hypothetical protein